MPKVNIGWARGSASSSLYYKIKFNLLWPLQKNHDKMEVQFFLIFLKKEYPSKEVGWEGLRGIPLLLLSFSVTLSCAHKPRRQTLLILSSPIQPTPWSCEWNYIGQTIVFSAAYHLHSASPAILAGHIYKFLKLTKKRPKSGQALTIISLFSPFDYDPPASFP